MNTQATLFIDCRCRLGEGPIWNPLLGQLFWFDILEKTLFAANESGTVINRWVFEETVTAAAIIDADTLAIASESAILSFDIRTGKSTPLAHLEHDIIGNRSNDGRINPAGGFWIGTMSHAEDIYSGSVYQFRSGKVKKLFGDIRIPNSTCFSPDGATAYFTDTPNKIILKRDIDAASGEPIGFWAVFADTSEHPGAPDGSVIDSEGYLWNARWGGSRVIRYAPDGSIDREVAVPASNVTCPAFGGANLKTLYITTASKQMTPEQAAREPHAGSLFSVQLDVAGLPDPLLVL